MVVLPEMITSMVDPLSVPKDFDAVLGAYTRQGLRLLALAEGDVTEVGVVLRRVSKANGFKHTSNNSSCIEDINIIRTTQSGISNADIIG